MKKYQCNRYYKCLDDMFGFEKCNESLLDQTVFYAHNDHEAIAVFKTMVKFHGIDRLSYRGGEVLEATSDENSNEVFVRFTKCGKEYHYIFEVVEVK